MEKVIHGANIGHIVKKSVTKKPTKAIQEKALRIFGANVSHVYKGKLFVKSEPIVEKPVIVVEKPPIVEPVIETPIESPKVENWKAKREKKKAAKPVVE